MYSDSYLRARVDTDVLIEADAVERAERVLAAAGWRRPVERNAELTAAQRHYTRDRAAGPLDELDLHWRIANPLVFARALSFEELRGRAIPVPALGPHARTLGLADALFLACLHRVAHHGDEYPAALALGRSPADRARLTGGSRRVPPPRRTRADVRHLPPWRGAERRVLRHARRVRFAEALGRGAAARPEPSARFIRDSRLVTVLRSDLATIDGWPRRVAFIAEHLFPSRAYMQSVYPACPPLLLPLRTDTGSRAARRSGSSGERGS